MIYYNRSLVGRVHFLFPIDWLIFVLIVRQQAILLSSRKSCCSFHLSTDQIIKINDRSNVDRKKQSQISFIPLLKVEQKLFDVFQLFTIIFKV